MSIVTGIAALLIGLLLIWKGRFPIEAASTLVFCNSRPRLFSSRRSFWLSLPWHGYYRFRAVNQRRVCLAPSPETERPLRVDSVAYLTAGCPASDVRGRRVIRDGIRSAMLVHSAGLRIIGTDEACFCPAR